MANQEHRQRRRGTAQESRSRKVISVPILLSLIGGAAILVAATAFILWPGEGAAFEPVDSIEYEHSPNHLHGIGLDPENDRLYLASHFGLFALEDGQMHQVGEERSDLMGFTINPNDPSEIFVSGHPQGGGNLGLLHSTDEGVTFEQIFTGVDDEIVDFHGMTINPADPDWFYGAFMGFIYRSEDRGNTFTAFQAQGLDQTGLCWGVPCLAPSANDPQTVYAGTSQGLMVSNDGAETWEQLSGDLGQVAAVSTDPANPERIVAYTEAMGLVESVDGGQSWESRQGDLPITEGGFVFDITLDSTNSDRMFVATMNNEVFETVDRGTSWTQIV
jgi:photosystem II stability/assembly factor-like uncharacterized protein